jgi:hypothetical protein
MLWQKRYSIDCRKYLIVHVSGRSRDFNLPGWQIYSGTGGRNDSEKAEVVVYLVDSLLYLRYKASTLFLAQGALLRNCRLDLILGSLLKHLMRMILPISSHP